MSTTEALLEPATPLPWPMLRGGDTALLTATMAIDALLLATGSMSLVWFSELPALAGGSLLLLLYLIYHRVRPTPRLAGLLRDALRLLLFTNAAAILSYLATGLLHRPLLDASLDAADRFLGFDWSASYRWLMARPDWMTAATLIYNSATAQVLVLLVTLGLLKQRRYADEFFYGFAISGLLVIAVGALLPAAGAFVSHGAAHAAGAEYLGTYRALRSGELRRIDLLQVKGLVQFPSFHAVLAGLFVYVSRRLKWLFWPLLVLNAAMLATCPALGGHYLVDLIAGLAILVVVMTTLRLLWGPTSSATHPPP